MEGLERTGSDSSVASEASTESGASSPKKKRYAREALCELMDSKFKRFCNLKCWTCDAACTKGFKGKSSLMAQSMMDTFWCKDCERILCSNHRTLHQCETEVNALETKKKMTKEEILADVRRKDEEKVQAEFEAAAARARLAAERSALYDEMRNRRKIIASKATHISDFIRTLSREAVHAGGSVHQAELLEMYTRVNAISIHLWNEKDTPSMGGLDEEAWGTAKDHYVRAVEISGRQHRIEGQPLGLLNSWEMPPAPDPNEEP